MEVRLINKLCTNYKKNYLGLVDQIFINAQFCHHDLLRNKVGLNAFQNM